MASSVVWDGRAKARESIKWFIMNPFYGKHNHWAIIIYYLQSPQGSVVVQLFAFARGNDWVYGGEGERNDKSTAFFLAKPSLRCFGVSPKGRLRRVFLSPPLKWLQDIIDFMLFLSDKTNDGSWALPRKQTERRNFSRRAKSLENRRRVEKFSFLTVFSTLLKEAFQLSDASEKRKQYPGREWENNNVIASSWHRHLKRCFRWRTLQWSCWDGLNH